MQRNKLTQRLRQLYLLEFINIFWLPLAFWIMGKTSNQEFGFNSMMAMALNGILLLEGSYLWLCISRQVRVGKQQNFIQIFSLLKTLNIGFIIATILFICVNPFSGTFDQIVTALFVLLAVLEHINYFEIQLMYDNANDIRYLLQYKRLKVAKLKRMLKK